MVTPTQRNVPVGLRGQMRIWIRQRTIRGTDLWPFKVKHWIISDEMLHIRVWLATLLHPAQTQPYMAEKEALIQTAVHSELQHYTKALAFIWPTAHHSPQHHSGSQEVSMFLEAHWLWHWQHQHFILHSQGTQQRRTVMFLLSKQVGCLLAHTTVYPHVFFLTVLMQHTDWTQSKENQMC